MLYLFAGPTPLLDPAAPIAVGGKPVFRDAGSLQQAIAVIGTCEQRPTVQYRKEGVHTLARRTELPAERYYRRLAQSGVQEKTARALFPFNPAADPYGDEPLASSVVGEAPAVGPPMAVRASEKLADLAGGFVDHTWFPDGWSFGNGVTTNVWAPQPGGVPRLVSWCVLGPAAAALVAADAGARRALHAIMEGPA